MGFRIGYFEDFLDAHTILIAGDSSALQLLADALRQLENSTVCPIRIHEQPGAQAYGGVTLIAYPISQERGIRRTHPQYPQFSWNHSGDGWLECAEKIETVARSTSASHNYLDCIEPEDAVVMVSKGEYDDVWWSRNS